MVEGGNENDADTNVYIMQYSTLKTAPKKNGFHPEKVCRVLTRTFACDRCQ